MVVDTVGNRYSTSLGVYRNGQIEWIKRFRYPNSIGLFYSSATRLLGFVPLSDECKVMSAAAHGKPKWASWINQKVVDYNADGDYTFLHNLERGVGTGTLDWDIAASVQQVTQNILLSLATWLQKETGLTNLAYADGARHERGPARGRPRGHRAARRGWDNRDAERVAHDEGRAQAGGAVPGALRRGWVWG